MSKNSLIFFAHMGLTLLACYLAARQLLLTQDRAIALLSLFFTFFTILWLLSFLLSRQYFRKIINIFLLLVFFVKEFIKANLKLTYEILSVDAHLQPAVVALPLDIKSDLGIMLLSNIINLTPGTLILDVSQDHKFLYVHTLYLEGGSVESFKASLKNGFERKIIAVLE